MKKKELTALVSAVALNAEIKNDVWETSRRINYHDDRPPRQTKFAVHFTAYREDLYFVCFLCISSGVWYLSRLAEHLPEAHQFFERLGVVPVVLDDDGDSGDESSYDIAWEACTEGDGLEFAQEHGYLK